MAFVFMATINFYPIHSMVFGQDAVKTVTIEEVVEELCLKSNAAQIERLNYQNKLLQFENYQKSYLPSVSLNLTPVSFNRSLRLLQQPTDGSYSYVEDYSNNSNMGVTIKQKIGVTGGELSLNSSINYLNEFSRKQNSFSTTPFSIGYSQRFWGEGKLYRLERKIEHAKKNVAIKQYCSALAEIQRLGIGYYLSALLGKMERDFSHKVMQNTDTLLQLARIKLENGYITEYDLKEIELQSVKAEYAFEKACKNYEEFQDRLAVFLGTERIGVTIPKFKEPSLIDVATVMYYVRKNSMYLRQLEIQALEAERSLYTTKSNNLFNGNVSLNYGVNKYAESFIGAYRNVNTRQSIVVGFQIPIFQWGINRNRLQIAKNNYETDKIERERQLREFENEVRETTNNYNHCARLWQTSQKAYQLSMEHYALLVQKFSLGKVSVYELTTAQSEQNDAMHRYYSAIKDTYNSYFTLRNMALYDFRQNVELEKIFIVH